MDGNTIPNVPAMLRFGKQYYAMLIPDEEAKNAGKNNGDVKGVKTLIEVGEQSDVDIEILSGLSGGNQVLVQAPTLPGGTAQFGGRGRR